MTRSVELRVASQIEASKEMREGTATGPLSVVVLNFPLRILAVVTGRFGSLGAKVIAPQLTGVALSEIFPDSATRFGLYAGARNLLLRSQSFRCPDQVPSTGSPRMRPTPCGPR